MSVFEYQDYRAYLRGYIRGLPRKGRGELSRFAKLLRVNTTLISQIMSGTREFNHDQTFVLSQYLGHSELETEYFGLLVQIRRAATAEYRKYLEGRLALAKTEALKLAKRISHEKKMTDRERAVFCSSWIYSAVHLYTSIKDKGVTLEETASRFSITKNRAAEILRFLVGCDLCVEKSGKFQMGVQSTFIEHGSPYFSRNLSNWRIKAIQKSESFTDSEMMYSGQFSLSKKDFENLRARFTEYLKETHKTVTDSKAEDIACLNLDLFWIDP